MPIVDILKIPVYHYSMPRSKIATPRLGGIKGRSATEESIRTEIARGELVPGQRLVETELSERYGATRNSVRLALDALCADGLVVRIPNHGARVRTVSLTEAVEIMECRMVLDGLLTRKAVENGTDDDIAGIKSNLDSMEQLLYDLDLARYSELIQVHHSLVQRAARHRVGSDIVGTLQGQIVRHQFRLSLRPFRAKNSLKELRTVVEAIVRRDADAAEVAARIHFSKVIAALREEAEND